MARQRVPARPVMAQVGNYAAPVDTSGMDPEMKKMMTEHTSTIKKASRPTTPLGWLKKMLGVH